MTIGRVYKLFVENELEVYIGSTCNSLNIRLSKHKSNYRNYLHCKCSFVTSFKLFEKYGFKLVKIILLTHIEFENKQDLFKLECQYIKSNTNCINKNIPNRTDKEYREDNKDKINQYIIDNKDLLKEYKKNYYDINNEAIKEKNNTKNICLCGGKFTNSHKSKHVKTSKHQTYLKSQQLIININIPIKQF